MHQSPDEIPPPGPKRDDLFWEESLITLSHELRTPLAVAKGYATSLLHHEDRLSREDRRTMVNEIDHACDRMEQVIQQMVQSARLLQGHLPLQPQSQDLLRLTHIAMARVEDAERANGQRITVQPAPSTPIWILADERLLTDAMAHLLINAYHFSLEGSPILVAIQPFPHHVQWSVQDRGIGIAPDHLPRIFDPFYRVATELTHEVGGLGLGLTFCQRVIALHGGTLQVASEMGVGSRFWFDLPREDLT
jgi:signal transduction histidine kinase